MTRSSALARMNCANTTRVSFSSLEEWSDVGLNNFPGLRLRRFEVPLVRVRVRCSASLLQVRGCTKLIVASIVRVYLLSTINSQQSPLFLPLTSTMVHPPWISYFKDSTNHNKMQLPRRLMSYKSWLPQEAARPEPSHHGLLTYFNTTDSNRGTSFVSHSLSRVRAR